MRLMLTVSRNFLMYVDKGFKEQGIRTDTLFLSPRMTLAAVLRRQILEGVQAVMRLTRQSQLTGKVPLQIFDRRGGTGNVSFEGLSLSTILLQRATLLIS